jgi:hypothetical protein
VQAHKATGCNGKRDATAFCAVQAFDDAALARDYQFLENAIRSVDSASRRAQDGNIVSQPARLQPKRQELERQARHRGVRLELLPHGMQRQRENTSRYDARRRMLRWRVELVFARADDARHVEAAVDEDTPLVQLLRSLLRQPDDAGPLGKRAREAGQRALTRHRLSEYAAHEIDALRVFLPVPGRRMDEPLFHALPTERTLAELLRGKALIEFPALHVATPAEAAGFPVAEPGTATAAPAPAGSSSTDTGQEAKRPCVVPS